MQAFWISLTLLCIAVGTNGDRNLAYGVDTPENYLFLVKQDNGAMQYEYLKPYWPYCTRLEFTAQFASMVKPSATETQRQIVTSDFGRRDTKKYWYRWKGKLRYYHEGIITPRVNWLSADVTVKCYYFRKMVNSKSRRTDGRLSNVIGVLLYPRNGRLSTAVLVKDWSWEWLSLSFKGIDYTSYHPDGNPSSVHSHCFPSAATLTKTGTIIVECGSYEVYGLSKYETFSKPKFRNQSPLIRTTGHVYFHKGFEERAHRPLPLILIEVHFDSENSEIVIGYVYQLYTVWTQKVFMIEEDKRFSDAEPSGKVYNITDSRQGYCTSNPPSATKKKGEPAVASQSSEYSSSFPASLAIDNAIMAGFTHTQPLGDKWWMVYKPDWGEIGVVIIHSREGYRYRLSNVYILTAKSSDRSITPSLNTNVWKQQMYSKLPLGNLRTTYQFLPLVSLTHLAIYSANPTDALSLNEVETKGECLQFSRPKFNETKGVDYIITMFTYQLRSTGDVTSKKVYARFHSRDYFDDVSRKVCQTYKYGALKQYYGCGNGTLTDQQMNECKAKNPPTLKDLLDCLQPNSGYEEIEADKEQPKKWPEDSITIDKNYVDYEIEKNAKPPQSLIADNGNVNSASWCLLVTFILASKILQ